MGPVARYLTDDHRRLEELFARAPHDPAAWVAFRKGLLRHIGLEEKILLPAAQRARGGEPLAEAARLRRDHGALAALLVPPPSPTIRAALQGILARHNLIEEGPSGVYAEGERLLGGDAETVLAALRDAPEVPVHPHVDSELAAGAAERALARAGYRLDEFPVASD